MSSRPPSPALPGTGTVDPAAGWFALAARARHSFFRSAKRQTPAALARTRQQGAAR